MSKAPELQSDVEWNEPSIATKILSHDELGKLNDRSNWKGLLQLFGHLTIMGISGYVWATNPGFFTIPALITYGFSFAAMFAPMHEASHRTAFSSNQLNDIVAWTAGLLSFYNSTFYRRYHKWHHRFTQIPDKDPELSDGKPTNLGAYLLELSGLPWWIGKIRGHFRIALGHVEEYPFIPETARSQVIQSVRLQLAVYLGAIAIPAFFGHTWLIQYWLLPLAVGQPILRAILLSEHTGCTYDNNRLTNTRTTLTLFPLQFLMWNMPFHAEHHLYPSIPFHALPSAHETLRSHFTHIDPGYIKVQRDLIAALD